MGSTDSLSFLLGPTRGPMGEREVSGARHNKGARKRFYLFFFVCRAMCTVGVMGCSRVLISRGSV